MKTTTFKVNLFYSAYPEEFGLLILLQLLKKVPYIIEGDFVSLDIISLH